MTHHNEPLSAGSGLGGLGRSRVQGFLATASLTMVWGLLSRAGTIVAMGVAAQILEGPQFGKVASVQILTMSLASLGGTGLQVLLIHRLASEGNNEAAVAGAFRLAIASTTAFGMATALTFLAYPETLSWVLFAGLDLEQGVLWALPWALGAVTDALVTGALVGLGRTRVMAVSGAVQSAATIIIVPLIALQNGFVGAIVGFSIAAWIPAAIFLFSQWRLVSAAFNPARRARVDVRPADLITTVLPVTLAAAFWSWGQLAANVTVLHATGGFADTAKFAIAMQFFSALNFAPQMMGVATVSMLTQQRAAGQSTAATRTSIATGAVVLVFGACAGAALYLVSPSVLAVLGPKYVGAASAVGYAAFAVALAAPQNIMAQSFVSIGRFWSWAGISAIGGAANGVVAYYSAGNIADPLSLAFVAAFAARGAAGLVVFGARFRKAGVSQ